MTNKNKWQRSNEWHNQSQQYKGVKQTQDKQKEMTTNKGAMKRLRKQMKAMVIINTINY